MGAVLYCHSALVKGLGPVNFRRRGPSDIFKISYILNPQSKKIFPKPPGKKKFNLRVTRTLQAIDIKNTVCYEEDRVTAMPERNVNNYSGISRSVFVKGTFKGLKYVVGMLRI